MQSAAVSVALKQLCAVCFRHDAADIRINTKNTHQLVHMWKLSVRHLLHVRLRVLNFFSLSLSHTLLNPDTLYIHSGLERIQSLTSQT